MPNNKNTELCSRSTLLSIIVPVYQVENYVEACILSILRELDSRTDVELIVVDDGSKDASMTIVNGLVSNHPFVKVVVQANGGLSSARNTGLGHASGDYVWFVDSDDEIVEGSLNEILGLISKSHTDIIHIPICRETRNQPAVILGDTSLSGILQKSVFFNVSTKSGRYTPMAQAYCVRLKHLGELRFRAGLIHEDIPFSAELLSQPGLITFAGRPLYRYKIRPGSITTTTHKDRKLTSYRAIGDILHKIGSSPDSNIRKSIKRRQLQILLACLELPGLGVYDYADVFARSYRARLGVVHMAILIKEFIRSISNKCDHLS